MTNYPNGEIPRNALARIYHPTLVVHLATEDHCAAAWNAMFRAAHEENGVLIYAEGPEGAYRTLEGQREMRAMWCARGACGNAAVPGTSLHGLGKAVDLKYAVQWDWIDAHGSSFGWVHHDAYWEEWHRHYIGGFTRPNVGPSLAYPVLQVGCGGRGHHNAVVECQRRLRGNGHKVTADGDFGRKTGVAVMQFRHEHGLGAHPVVNERTWRELRRKH